MRKESFLEKGIKCNVPHRYMREMVTGKSEDESNDNEQLENN